VQARGAEGTNPGRKGVERDCSCSAIWLVGGENKGSEKGCLLAVDVRWRGNRRLSRGNGGSGTSRLMSLAPCQDRWLAKRASEVGPASQDGVTSTPLAPREADRSEAITVK
jgi:hypothetical protein